MKDITQQQWEAGRPRGTAVELINFCLSALYKDKDHYSNDEIVHGLTFEELIGALLVARDTAQQAIFDAELHEHQFDLLFDAIDSETFKMIEPQLQDINRMYMKVAR
jgi:hypothetical protein